MSERPFTDVPAAGVLVRPTVSSAVDRLPSAFDRFVDRAQIGLAAFALALALRAFFVEAFIIPTGSMAETLLGAHAAHICTACGWNFDYGLSSEADSGSAGFGVPDVILCPNCHASVETRSLAVLPRAGDRILVHKWPMGLDFLVPLRRWDVIVFRDPKNPQMNYIKRLIGLPGENVEVIDGDVFIDGLIVRKTTAAQEALWTVVYDQDYLPFDAAGDSPRPRWSTDDRERRSTTTGWSGLDSRVFQFDGRNGPNTDVVFNRRGSALYIQDVYGYNAGSSEAYVGDVRVRMEWTLRYGSGALQLELTRGDVRFLLDVHQYGCELFMASPPDAGLRSVAIAGAYLAQNQPQTIEFGHVDYRVFARLDGVEVISTTEAQYRASVAALRGSNAPSPAQLRMRGTLGAFELRHVRVDRDVYYTYRPGFTRRASAGRPFKLYENEFFVLGDNSAHSHDSREWAERGPHLPDDYRPGTVLADQIVGRAAFVYLPGWLPWNEGGQVWLPDFGSMRFVR